LVDPWTRRLFPVAPAEVPPFQTVQVWEPDAVGELEACATPACAKFCNNFALVEPEEDRLPIRGVYGGVCVCMCSSVAVTSPVMWAWYTCCAENMELTLEAVSCVANGMDESAIADSEAVVSVTVTVIYIFTCMYVYIYTHACVHTRQNKTNLYMSSLQFRIGYTNILFSHTHTHTMYKHLSASAACNFIFATSKKMFCILAVCLILSSQSLQI
jgi:hypothetical protein